MTEFTDDELESIRLALCVAADHYADTYPQHQFSPREVLTYVWLLPERVADWVLDPAVWADPTVKA